MSRYPVGIIGPGALGLVFAERISRRGAVAVIARNEARARELRDGITVDGARFVPDVHCAESPPAADWVLVLVKAGDTPAAAEAAARMAPLGVLSLQNGWVEDELRAPLGGIKAAQGATTEGALRDGRHVRHTGAGETLAPQGFEPLVAALAEAGFRARIEPRIREARLRKLLVSACINPLTALHRIPNGRLLESRYASEVDALAREGAAILIAEGVPINGDAAVDMVASVARATAANRSSMLQDVEAGRETELEFVTGALLRMAHSNGIRAPTHERLYRRLGSRP